MVDELEAAIGNHSIDQLTEDHCTLLIELVYPTIQRYHSNVKLSQAEYSYFPAEADLATRVISGKSSATPTESPPASSHYSGDPISATKEVGQLLDEYHNDRNTDLVRKMDASAFLAREYRRMALELHWGLQFVTVGSIGNYLHNTSYRRDAEHYDDHLEGTFDFENKFINRAKIDFATDGYLAEPRIGEEVKDMSKFKLGDGDAEHMQDSLLTIYFDQRMKQRLTVDLFEEANEAGLSAAKARAA